MFVDAYTVIRLLAEGGIVAFDDSPDPYVRKVLAFVRSSWPAGLEELDLSRFRADAGRSLKYQAARRLGRAPAHGISTRRPHFPLVERPLPSLLNQ